MSPFVSGALGAVAVLAALGLARRLLHLAHRRRWRRGPWPLRRLFAWLEARPEQEAVLAEVAEALRQDAAALRGEGRAAREAVAELFALETLDRGAVEAALRRGVGALDDLSARLAGSLARVHATLDAAQRARVAALLRHGPPHGHRHGRWAHGRS